MPTCVIKVCRNYLGRLKTTYKVTYHRLPTDPVMKSKWVDIIRSSRGEDFWKPAKSTVICSDHFSTKDMYFVHNQERRRLKKVAVPRKALFLSSLKSDESENSDDDQGIPSKALFRSTVQFDTSKNSDENMDLPVKNPEPLADSLVKKESERESKDCQPSSSAKNDDDDIGDFSDLDSIFDTPEEEKLRKELRKKSILQKKHTIIIQSLRRKNNRLKKKIASYKKMIVTLKKENATLRSTKVKEGYG
ncbi:unnamed protein product [Chilo suppressalis]|uniref:THAP-type domain-containing protein n=1 Tax=Chilo suppressalis TaxID=168631 RepID=A0ABN8BFQ9_CHISP|nr:unnamed protein product [Chilo suppressalis]